MPTYRRASSTVGNGSQQHRWYTLSRTGCNAAQAISADTTPDFSNRTSPSVTRKPAFTFLQPQHIDRTGHPPSPPCRSPPVNQHLADGDTATGCSYPANGPPGPHSPVIERTPSTGRQNPVSALTLLAVRQLLPRALCIPFTETFRQMTVTGEYVVLEIDSHRCPSRSQSPRADNSDPGDGREHRVLRSPLGSTAANNSCPQSQTLHTDTSLFTRGRRVPDQ